MNLPLFPASAALAATSDAAADFASFDVPPWLWLGLVAAIVVMLVVDLCSCTGRRT